MFWRYVIIAAIFFASEISVGNSSRILAICPRAAISHQSVFRGLTLALNRQGHELVVVTSDLINDPNLNNYTEIDISELYHTNTKEPPSSSHWLKTFWKLSANVNLQTDQILNNRELKKLYAPHSGEKFDLILLEFLYWPAFLPLATRFDAPVIGLSPMGLTMNVQYALGNPIITSHPSNWELYSSNNGPLTFYQRLDNFITFWKFLYFFKNTHIPAQQAIARKYFGNDIPDINELEKNVSLVFVNEAMPISYLKPNVPKIIRFNGFHMSKTHKPLPENLQKILDESTQGFVYMSLGSNMKSTMLSNETRNELIAAFSRLPYTILWKFENDVLPGKPDNVHIMKWVPQQAVLAHPNLKVFVYQGGLQSTEEVVSNGVPVIGLPTWADQRMLIDKLVSLGVAIKFHISTINGNELEAAIRTIASNDSYKENMLKLRQLLNDNSYDLLQNAIWWTEYVIRHKGAPHLHSTTADEPWYRRNDIDMIAFILAGFILILILLLIVSYKLLVSSFHLCNVRSASTKKKFN